MKPSLKFIEWSYVAPRLTVLVVLCVLLWFCLDPLLRWGLVWSGQAATGSQVDIKNVETSLLRGSAHLHGVQISDPRNREKNLVQFDEAGVIFDRGELLKRRYVIDDGYIHGLRINADRAETAGAKDLSISLPKLAARLNFESLRQAAGLLKDVEWEKHLETVRVAKEVAERWPREYQALAARVEQIENHIRAIRQFVENPRLNPVSQAADLQRAYQDLSKMHLEAVQIEKEVKRLRDQVPQDRDRLVAAKDNDLQRLRRLTDIQELDPTAFADYLLGEQTAEQVQEIVSWVCWIRNFVPPEIDELESYRYGGTYVQFPGLQEHPDFLIRRLAVDGETTIGGRRLWFTGTAHDVTHQSKTHGKPIVLDLETTGDVDLQISAVVDRTQATPKDRIEIHCPGIPMPQRTLGRPEQFAIDVSPAKLCVDLVLSIDDGRLDGEIKFAQHEVALRSHLADDLGGELVAQPLNRALRDIRNVDVVVNMRGELSQPEWHLHSTAGQQLAGCFQIALKNELTQLQQQAMQYVQNLADQQWARTQDLIGEGERYILSHVSEGDKQITEMGTRLAGRLGLPLRNNPLGISLEELPIRIGNRPRVNDFLPGRDPN